MPNATPFVYKYIQESDLLHIPIISQLKLALHMWFPSLFTPIIQRNTVVMTFVIFGVFFLTIILKSIIESQYEDFDATLLSLCDGLDDKPAEPKTEGYKEVSISEGIEQENEKEDEGEENETEKAIELKEKEAIEEP